MLQILHFPLKANKAKCANPLKYLDTLFEANV